VIRLAEKKCECNCKMMLVGIAIACLIIGGLAGYWYASSNSNYYLAKGAQLGCVTACNDDDACIQEKCVGITPATIGNGDYLQKRPNSGCCRFGMMCCGSEQVQPSNGSQAINGTNSSNKTAQTPK